jgi:hypothetical protein
MSTEVKTVARWTGIVDAHPNGGFVSYGDFLTLRSDLVAAEARAQRAEQALRELVSAADEYKREMLYGITSARVESAWAAARAIVEGKTC